MTLKEEVIVKHLGHTRSFSYETRNMRESGSDAIFVSSSKVALLEIYIVFCAASNARLLSEKIVASFYNLRWSINRDVLKGST